MKRIANLQSNYIPWKGYFDLIASVDEFIIYVEMQYTKNDWRNRNKIKTNKGLEWLTIPVRVESISQKINETLIFDSNWSKKHKAALQTNYTKANCYKEIKDFIFNLSEEASQTNNLSEINLIFIKRICSFLNIKTKISLSINYNLGEGKTERLINLCKQSNSDVYISGPSAKDYLEETLFVKNNIELQWMDYSGYSEYQQLHPPFEHGVSILDLIFNEVNKAENYFKTKLT